MQSDMQPFLILGGSIAVIVLLWAVASYNSLVRLRNHCDESWSGIDTELKRRYDLIPNLVSVVKGYAEYERDVLDRVIAARNAAVSHSGSPGAQAQDERVLEQQMRRLFAVVEAYPDLKASRHYLELQNELSITEDRLQRARRFYNANVRDYNTRLEVVPTNMIANMFSFQQREYFEIGDASERQVPGVTL